MNRVAGTGIGLNRCMHGAYIPTQLTSRQKINFNLALECGSLFYCSDSVMNSPKSPIYGFVCLIADPLV